MRRILSSIRDGVGFDILLVGLTMIFLLALAGLPLVYNVLMSFQQVDMFNLNTFWRPFVGLENYQAVIEPARVLAGDEEHRLLRFRLDRRSVLARLPAGDILHGEISLRLDDPRRVPGFLGDARPRGRRALGLDPCRRLRRAERHSQIARHHRHHPVLEVRPQPVHLGGDHRQYLARPGLQHDAAVGRTGRHPARSLRGGGTRRRQCACNGSPRSPFR